MSTVFGGPTGRIGAVCRTPPTHERPPPLVLVDYVHRAYYRGHWADPLQHRARDLSGRYNIPLISARSRTIPIPSILYLSGGPICHSPRAHCRGSLQHSPRAGLSIFTSCWFSCVGTMIDQIKKARVLANSCT